MELLQQGSFLIVLDKLNNLYRQLLLDYAEHPKYAKPLTDATHEVTLHNTTCGDTLMLTAEIEDNVIKRIGYSASGCTISQASASIMSEIVLGKKITEIPELTLSFSKMVTGEDLSDNEKKDLGDATLLDGVTQFPARIKCATMAWKAIYQLVEGEENE